VGESGCGKTTTAKTVLLIEKPTAGFVLFEGREIHKWKGPDRRHYRASVQAVFQDPWSSLNPRMPVGTIIAEPLFTNLRLTRKEITYRVHELLSAVGLDPGASRDYPHEFSGGQRQRIAVARALATTSDDRPRRAGIGARCVDSGADQ
jgi:ABC-type microcin C transport system duplicated ATPase subunit YejF